MRLHQTSRDQLKENFHMQKWNIHDVAGAGFLSMAEDDYVF